MPQSEDSAAKMALGGSTLNIRKKLLGFSLIILIISILGGSAIYLNAYNELESRTWDWRVRLVAPSLKAVPLIKTIMIDQGSLEHFARDEKIFWVWPRGLYEPIVRFLREGGAKGVAFDILFTEPSLYGVEDDRAFAASHEGMMPVVHAVAKRSGGASSPPDLVELFETRQADAAEATGFDKRYIFYPETLRRESITVPTHELLEASHTFGDTVAESDSDGIYRHMVTGGYFQNTPVLSLPFALFDAVDQGATDVSFLKDMMDVNGNLTVQFTDPESSFHAYPIDAIIRSFQQIHNGETPLIDPAVFKDAWVFIGMNAPGLLDLRPTPLSPKAPGVEYHAQVLDNLLRQSFVKKVPITLTVFVSILLAGAASAIVIFFRRVRDQSLLLILLAGLWLALSYWTALNGWWLPMILPAMMAFFAVVLSFAFQYYLEGRQHRFIRDAFRHYVSPSVIERIVSDPDSLSLGGERRELTIYFSDIVGFTTLSENIDASGLVPLLNLYLTEMTEIILESGGTVDKYVGDAIVAFWNAPLSVPDHPGCGIRAAVECQKRLDALQQQFIESYGASIKARIGLNTGMASVGNFGSHERFNYTMIGDAVNLAARLEGANKYFGTSVLMAEQTYRQAAIDLPCRRVANIRVVGKSTTISVFEPLDAASPHVDVEMFEAALKLFDDRRLREALDAFKAMALDPVAQIYAARLEKDLSQGDPLWEPVWNLSGK